ncbi:Protein fam49a [Lobosporangium transversale]|uniref:FAM49 family protein n=1 Tax=Lobosporangium transversale TaxID=64571 RepID=A0A1Y2GA74_9FUNG|nr:FAM49 family protein [Lobosporangium transversale]KAF9915337.1 Protein fam49a [Lobosporangium transversale]ORZ05325.1 FAM49 family protein [Lobosporangium transversale]|eukprot:XP_021877017.1 FAM49 family protein [Lobosporangium transversale]
MGNFLSQFNDLINKDGDSKVPDVQLDFEDASMTDEDLESYSNVLNMLDPTGEILDQLRNYQGCGDYIRQAIGTPGPEAETEAWNHVVPAVTKLKMFYQYSTSIETSLPQILQTLCIGDVNKNLERHQALARILCQLLDFVFEFDSLKMKTPQIQNDFSYYRRCLSRGKLSNEVDLKSAMNEDELANHVSMFYAYPTPMLKTVTEVTTQFVAKNRVGRSVSECLATLAGVCYHSVSNSKKKPQRPETTAFCLRVMVISIIIYDHIDPQGAFSKSSPINLKNSVKAIQTYGNTNDTPNLMSALRYNTKHLNDPTTPKSLKTLITGTA